MSSDSRGPVESGEESLAVKISKALEALVDYRRGYLYVQCDDVLVASAMMGSRVEPSKYVKVVDKVRGWKAIVDTNEKMLLKQGVSVENVEKLKKKAAEINRNREKESELMEDLMENAGLMGEIVDTFKRLERLVIVIKLPILETNSPDMVAQIK